MDALCCFMTLCVLHGTLCTAWYSVQHDSLYSMTLYSMTLYSMTLYSMTLCTAWLSVQHDSVQHDTVQHDCTAWYFLYSVMHDTVQHDSVQRETLPVHHDSLYSMTLCTAWLSVQHDSVQHDCTVWYSQYSMTLYSMILCTAWHSVRHDSVQGGVLHQIFGNRVGTAHEKKNGPNRI